LPGLNLLDLAWTQWYLLSASHYSRNSKGIKNSKFYNSGHLSAPTWPDNLCQTALFKDWWTHNLALDWEMRTWCKESITNLFASDTFYRVSLVNNLQTSSSWAHLNSLQMNQSIADQVFAKSSRYSYYWCQPEISHLESVRLDLNCPVLQGLTVLLIAATRVRTKNCTLLEVLFIARRSKRTLLILCHRQGSAFLWIFRFHTQQQMYNWNVFSYNHTDLKVKLNGIQRLGLYKNGYRDFTSDNIILLISEQEKREI
jgi:hypothetical protein